MLIRFAAAAFAVGLTLGPALAGPVTDFETQFRATYGTYRAALFSTNSGQKDMSEAALGKLENGLSALLNKYLESPPPQYADDPQWSDTMSKVENLVALARTEAGAGELEKAHATLEGVRDLVGELHARNGIETFSDRMNAYHAEMEIVLAADLATLDAPAVETLREDAAVLDYLARDLLNAPPADASGNGEYQKLAAAFQASVADFLAATRSGDPEKIRVAVGGLKKPYSLFFLKFG